jgi:hypothetical protein
MELTPSSDDNQTASHGAGATEELPFYAISVMKLVLLSLATFTVYEIFCFTRIGRSSRRKQVATSGR